MGVSSGSGVRGERGVFLGRIRAARGGDRRSWGRGLLAPPRKLGARSGLGHPLAYPGTVEERREFARDCIVPSPGVPSACEAELRERYEDHAIDGVERG